LGFARGGGRENEGIYSNKGDEGGGKCEGMGKAGLSEGRGVGVEDREKVGARQEAGNVGGSYGVDGMSMYAVEDP
jgi:hypothetical protein